MDREKFLVADKLNSEIRAIKKRIFDLESVIENEKRFDCYIHFNTPKNESNSIVVKTSKLVYFNFIKLLIQIAKAELYDAENEFESI